MQQNITLLNSAFEDYYRSIYGRKWEELRDALCKERQSVAYSYNLTEPYLMDSASILAAKLLRLPDSGNCGTGVTDATGSAILDACAAPGGKTLVIASLMDENTKLISNDLSKERGRRLLNVINTHTPAEIRKRITVTSFDAAALPRRQSERGRFDAILLDAPCSSERHIIQNVALLKKWTPARPRFLAARQWALLSAAFLLLKPGGSLVYSTCAINPEENDSVAGRLLTKYKGAAELDPPDFEEGEACKFGRLILPAADSPAGPIYAARFRKGA